MGFICGQPFAQGASGGVCLDVKLVFVLDKGVPDLGGPVEMVHLPFYKKGGQIGIRLCENLVNGNCRIMEGFVRGFDLLEQGGQGGHQGFGFFSALTVKPLAKGALPVIELD